jgi:hypothetical protein
MDEAAELAGQAREEPPNGPPTGGLQPVVAAASAAVEASAPRAFAPVPDAVLADVSPATAASFCFRVPLATPQGETRSAERGSGAAALPAPSSVASDTAAAAAEVSGGAQCPAAARGDGGLVPGEAMAAAPSATAAGALQESQGGPWRPWGAAEAHAALLGLELLPAGARARASEAWVTNHYRWIVWKLVSYERRYERYFESRMVLRVL